MLKCGEGGRREEEVGDTGSCLGDGMRVRFGGIGEDIESRSPQVSRSLDCLADNDRTAKTFV